MTCIRCLLPLSNGEDKLCDFCRRRGNLPAYQSTDGREDDLRRECSICRGFHGPEIRHACE